MAAPLRTAISNKAALSYFNKWVKRRKKPVLLTEDDFLALRRLPCHTCKGDLSLTAVPFILKKPNLPVDASNVEPTCGYCKTQKPAADFNPISFAKSQLKRNWKKTPMALAAKNKARRAVGRYECAKCKELFQEKDMELDHIDPTTPIGVTAKEQSLDDYAIRLLCPESNLQYLCKRHHEEKTVGENALRPKTPRKKKSLP